MKYIWQLTIILALSLSFYSCEKTTPDDIVGNGNTETNTETNTEDIKQDEYYVRYKAYCMFDMKLTVNTDKGLKSFDVKSSTFDETFGPVSKGFKASAKITEPSSLSNNRVSIYVCKESAPFSLKETGISNASYTIDF